MTYDDADGTRVRRFGKKKDTKRWCRGHVGREHQPEIVRDKSMGFVTSCSGRSTDFLPCLHLEQCSECGKTLRRWLPVEECPDRQND